MEVRLVKTPKEVKELLITPFPEYIHKQKPNGKGTLSYVSGNSVIDKLNQTFGHLGWSWEIQERFVQRSEPKVTKFKYENGKKVNLTEPIYEEQLPVAHVVGKLTVSFYDEKGEYRTVSKTAPGAQCLVGGQSEQENIFKGAHTDAIKKAATMFGIGLELYRDENESYFFGELNYEDPWTEELIEENKESFSFISSFKDKYGMQDEDLAEYMNHFSNGEMPNMSYLAPDNIKPFVEYLMKIDSQAQTEG